MNTHHELVKLNLRAVAELSQRLAECAGNIADDKPTNLVAALAEIDIFASQVRGHIDAAKANFKRATIASTARL